MVSLSHNDVSDKRDVCAIKALLRNKKNTLGKCDIVSSQPASTQLLQMGTWDPMGFRIKITLRISNWNILQFLQKHIFVYYLFYFPAESVQCIYSIGTSKEIEFAVATDRINHRWAIKQKVSNYAINISNVTVELLSLRVTFLI